METNELISKIERAVPGSVLEARPFGRTSIPSLWIEMQSVARIAEVLVSEAEIRLDWLENLSVMDIDQALVLSYFLRSTTSREELILRGSVVPPGADEEADVPSVTKFWPMAQLSEREISDLFGIRFTPGERTPLFLPAGWQGFPLRKSYVFPSEFLDILHMRPAGQTRSSEGVEV